MYVVHFCVVLSNSTRISCQRPFGNKHKNINFLKKFTKISSEKQNPTMLPLTNNTGFILITIVVHFSSFGELILCYDWQMPCDSYQMLDEKSVWLITVHVKRKRTHLHHLGGCDSCVPINFPYIATQFKDITCVYFQIRWICELDWLDV